MNKIDFRKKSQYIGNMYIWIGKHLVRYGVNGTSFHDSISRDEFSNEDIMYMIYKKINNDHKTIVFENKF